HRRLASGLDTYLLEERRTPLVSIRLLLPMTGADDPPARHGLASFTASLLDDVASDPAFAPTEVERQRRERLAEWLRRRDQPSALAEEAFAAAVYGDSPYGHTLLGDQPSLEAMRRDEI